MVFAGIYQARLMPVKERIEFATIPNQLGLEEIGNFYNPGFGLPLNRKFLSVALCLETKQNPRD
jgi:hypothetical protein